MTVTYRTGQVLDQIRSIPDGTVDLVATSPPFLALRNYNDLPGQWGSEPDPATFLDNLLELACECRRVLAPHGSLAFELGDTYAGSGGAGGDYNEKGTREGQPKFSGSALSYRRETLRNRPQKGWPLPKSLCLTPTLFAASLAYGRNLLNPAHTFAPWLVRNVIVWARCLDGDTVVYARTPKGDGPARLLHLTQNWRPGQWQLWDGQRWTDVLGWEATEATDAIEIEFRNGERVNATRNHRWPTARGLVATDELVIGDVVPTVQLPEPAMPLDPSGLPDDMIGWFVGMYLAEGSLDSRGRIQITGHRDEAEHRLSRLRELAEAYHGTATVHAYATQAATVVVRSEVLRSVLAHYIDGKNARTKHLAPACWQRSNAFLRALVQGYLEGDGGYDAKNDRWRLSFTDNPWLARDLRVACARIGATCRLRRVKRYADHRAQFAGASSFIWRGEIRFGFASPAHERPAGQIVALRASKRRRFFDVTVEGEPHLFALGSGILTHNSNPPVGALGDKVRPATSYITVACPSPRRWFDLDAVRDGQAGPRRERTADPKAARGRAGGVNGFAADRTWEATGGAPPLDHWHDEPDGDLLWLINTQGSSLAHYAMWPPKLVERLILSMCPAQVCRTCGEPRRRITVAPTLGWSDCGHGDVYCRQCGVLVPWDYALRGSREEASSRPPVGAEEVLAEPIEGQSGQAEAPPDLRDMWGGLPGPDGDDEGLQQIMLCEAGAPGGPSQHDHGPGPSQPDMARRPEDQPSGLRAGVGAGGLPRQAEDGLHDGAPGRDAGTPRQAAGAARVGAPPQRGEGRQPAGESPDREPCEAARVGDLPELLAHVPSALAGHVCPCGSQDFVYRGDYRPGHVLDTFAGTGTTLAVADILGRDATGIDLDPANPALYPARYQQCWQALRPDAGPSPVTDHGEQLDLLGGVG